VPPRGPRRLGGPHATAYRGGVDPAERFAAEAASPDPSLEVLAVSIAGCDHPVDPEAVSLRLDQLAAGFAATGRHGAVELCRHLFAEQGLRGNTERYYDPANSFLDRVLARRLGIPISLSVVGILVGDRAGVPLVGVGMPGHFLLRDAHDAGLFLDPFTGGVALDVDDCRRRFERLHGTATDFDESLLEPTPTLEIVGRMLMNLTSIYLQGVERASLAWVLRLRASLPAATPALIRQLGGVLAAEGRWWEAAEAYERIAAMLPDAADRYLTEARRLRAHAN